MTNQEAIRELSALMTRQPDYAVALDKAISALQEQEAKTQLSAEGTTSDLISRRVAVALANSLKDDLPDDERIADTVMAHNEGILKYQTKLSLLPSAQPDGWLEQNKDKILQSGMEGREIDFRIGGRLFAIREKAQ